MRRLTARILLFLAALLSLLLSLSLPAPGNATPGQTSAQLALFALSVLSVIAAVLLFLRPAAGREITLTIGAAGLAMLGWTGWPLFLSLREGGSMHVSSVAVPLVLWSSLVVAGVCVLSRTSAR